MTQPNKQPVLRSTCQWDCTGQSRLGQTPAEVVSRWVAVRMGEDPDVWIQRLNGGV